MCPSDFGGMKHLNTKSRCFETSRDLMVRCLLARYVLLLPSIIIQETIDKIYINPLNHSNITLSKWNISHLGVVLLNWNCPPFDSCHNVDFSSTFGPLWLVLHVIFHVVLRRMGVGRRYYIVYPIYSDMFLKCVSDIECHMRGWLVVAIFSRFEVSLVSYRSGVRGQSTLFRWYFVDVGATSIYNKKWKVITLLWNLFNCSSGGDCSPTCKMHVFSITWNMVFCLRVLKH